MYPVKKLDVDKHVQECLKRMNNPTERNLRGLSFAKQYYKIGSYEDARRHINAYLSIRPNSAEAHRLLGQVYEKLGKQEAALQAYNTSLRLDPKQNSLVIKVCELLASDDVGLDQSGAKYFCEMAQNLDPNNPAIFNLKQRILLTQHDDPQEVTNLLLKELETRPTDVRLRIRLLKHLLQHNLTIEAYRHALEIDNKNLTSSFLTSFAWYETVAEVLVRYQKATTNAPLNWEFWFLSVSVFEQLSYLSLCEHSDRIKSANEYVNAVYNFDQTLTKAVQNASDCPDKQLLQEFVNHYTGQLCFHLVILLYKQAQRDLLDFKEMSNISLPLLFAACNSQAPDLQTVWFNHASELTKDMLKKWRKKASFRLSQVGHILDAAAKDKKTILLEQAVYYSRENWRENLYKKMFVSRDHQMGLSTSFFTTQEHLNEIVTKLPEKEELLRFDEESQLLYPDSLHHHVWLVLQNNPSDIKCTVFEGLQYTVKHLKNCGAETLNILDLQAFIYACALCAKQNQEESRLNMSFNFNKPSVLPAAITQELCTQYQKTFFSAAYKMYKNEYEPALDELRTTLVEGIKTIRCVDSTLNVFLAVHLANMFADRSRKLTKQSDIEANETRAEMYWKCALPLLEKMKNNQMISTIPNRLFTTKFKELSLSEICSHVENGKLFTAGLLMKKKEYERALALLESLRDPHASFYQAQIYKSMADDQIGQNREHVTSEMRSQNIILLSRSRDCLYLTLDRLREPSVDQKHPLNAQLGTEIEKIERLLSRFDSDFTNRHDCDLISDDRVSSPESGGEHYLSTNSFLLNGTRTMDNVNHSTPYRSNILRTEARPSPERLDAQLRQMSVLKDYAVNHIVEHNRSITETNKTLIEELKNIKEAVGGITTALTELKDVKQGFEELKDIKKTVTELKTTIRELDNLKSISDMVYQMRQEIVDLKRDISNSKTNQLSEEDIYGLANEYAADYNLSANLQAFNPPPLFPNYQARLPNPVYGANLYPGMYPAMYYGGLGLPQPFPGQEQLSGQDFRNIPLQNAVSALTQPPVSAPNLLNNPASFFKDAQYNVASSAPQSTRAPPVNVVITTSDPVPSATITTSQPILSVTIPPQHIKSSKHEQPHIFQIPLPTTTLATAPSVLNTPAPAISTKSLLSNIAPPIFSAVSNTSSALSVGLAPEKSESSLNTSNLSSTSLEEHDPCPDFKPIVPLPDEVPVNTGEENETVLFSERAKLYRFTAKEWKERGVGVLKLLKSNETGKIRLLMRRDQVHKICANHLLTADMVLTPMTKSDKAFVWAAHDFADEEMVVEKFCVRFKSAVEAQTFQQAFTNAQKELQSGSEKVPNTLKEQKPESFVSVQKELKTASVQDKKNYQKPESQTLGGFTFSTPPAFKSTAEPNIVEVAVLEPSKNTSFANLSFGARTDSPNVSKISSTPLQFGSVSITPIPKETTAAQKAESTVKDTGNDDEIEEFVPTVEFKPVMPLPELVEVKTGEEDCEVLFEARAKLLRFDTGGETKEWKERGVGTMKLLKSNATNTVRLVMRRDQVHKVCCNHQLMQSMVFKCMNDPKAVTWCAKDFSEGVIKAETFAIRFKTPEIAADFLNVITTAQRSLDESNNVSTEHVDKHVKHEPPKLVGFGDKCKPAKGSWECKNCYVVNQAKNNYCIACETPKNDTLPKEEASPASGSAFSFGVSNISSVANSWGKSFAPKEGSWECKSCYSRNDQDKAKCVACEAVNPNASDSAAKAETISVSQFGTTSTTTAWGKSFAPKEGSWECKSCYSRNDKEKAKCIACEAPNPDASISDAKPAAPSTPQFSFGIPATVPQNTSWGPSFAPKEGSWECKSCYSRNDKDKAKCVACEVPNPDATESRAKTVTPSIPPFSFGIPSTAAETKPTLESKADSKPESKPSASFSFGTPTQSTMSSATYSFGQNSNTPPSSTTQFMFGQKSTPTLNFGPSTEKFVFGSPQKHDFEFTPRSPRKSSTGQKEDESDNSCVEEEEINIYFKPVIPLPDKVDVKTGEEDEQVLYCHRAKLFRYVGGEWKERGLGDIKILRRQDDGKLRVLMRREQIHKICLNHLLTTDVKYLPKDGRTWLFHAADFSEGELSNDQFCIRFKDESVAKEFKDAIDDALNGVSSTTTDVKAIPVAVSVTDDDVKIISETQVTSEEEKEAVRLGLPRKFMSYRQLQDCTCDQCKKDDEYSGEACKKLDKSITSKADSSSGSAIKNLLAKPSLLATSTVTSAVTTPAVFSFKAAAAASEPSAPSTPTNKFGSGVFSFSQHSGNIFGGGNTTPTLTNIFNKSGSGSAVSTPSTTSISGGSVVSTPSNIFGGSVVSTPSTTSNLFDGSGSTSVISTPSTVASLFGSSSSTGIFASNALNVSASPVASIFGGNAPKPSIFGGDSASSTTATHVFGSTPSPALFKTSNQSFFSGTGGPTNLFGGGNTANISAISNKSSVFGEGEKAQENNDDSRVTSSSGQEEEATPVLDCNTGLSFASLAAKVSTDQPPAFGQTKNETTTPFSFLGAGAPVFGSASKANKNASTTENKEGDDEGTAEGGAGGDEEYDPHYEPIVPLPDAIEVTTGEEDETILFNERAKLYRYDDVLKEWKERGVGQMKILYHPQRNTYRLLLRREQVHKVVLNQLIVADLDIQPMKISANAWMWAGYNYTDEDSALEKLAVRFKNADLSLQFERVIRDVLNKLQSEPKQIQQTRAEQKPEVLGTVAPSSGDSEAAAAVEQILVPTSIENYETVEANNAVATESSYESVYNEDEDTEDDEEDERTVMFTKRCTLAEEINGEWKIVAIGDVQIYYDAELYGARISVINDSGVQVSNTLIGINTAMDIIKNNCTWRAVEWASDELYWRKLRATFSSEAAAQEFHSNYLEGHNYAQECDIVDQIHEAETEDTD